MSVFATLRRKRDRTKGAAPNGTVLVAESKSGPIFNSTPNLHKINPVKAPSSSSQRKKESCVFYPEENEDVIVEDEVTPRYGGFGNRRSSSAVSGDLHGGGKLSAGKSKGSTGSLRHFASMLSMFGSLKRTKSSKRVAYETQGNETEKRESSEFMRDKAAGKSSGSELTLSKSDACSTDSLCEGDIVRRMLTNTEPGVRSSSSSDDDDSRRGSTTISFKRSGTIEKSEGEQNFDYTSTKTEEELRRTKFMIQGIKKFNMDPKKGIEYLVEHDILQNTAEDVARFLKFGEGLSKTAIGNYLGEHIDFNEEVLQAFLDLHNFKDFILVQALREFLWSFRLPGESQKIDRMMEGFAKRYCQSNPGIFSCTDTCYLLSYSIIMLNTTLHNPSVKDKPTVEQFVQMNRDVDCGKSLNRVFLVHLYNSILTEPFKIPPEDSNDLVLTFFNPNIEGWLWKQGSYKTWKRRWFILSNNCLYYFKFTTDKSPRGIIPLENVNAKEVSSSKSNELYPFILFKKSSASMPSDVIKTCKTLSNGTTVLSQYHTITVASITDEDRKKWVQSINQNNSDSDFYDVLTLKKRNLEALRNSQTKGKRIETPPAGGKEQTPRKAVRKSLISHPSTAPDFEFKDKLPPKLLAPAGPEKDPNNYFKSHHVFSSTASISSGSAIEPDSSYGSFSDISRSRSESRIVDYSQEGSISSTEHDTGSIGSRRGIVGLEDHQDYRYDLSKKLSIIEESHNNQSDRSSSSSGGGSVFVDKGSSSIITANPVCLGYRKLSEERSSQQALDVCTGADSSDSYKCDISHINNKSLESNASMANLSDSSDVPEIEQNQNETDELSINVQRNDDNIVMLPVSTKLKYCRSGSMESDV